MESSALPCCARRKMCRLKHDPALDSMMLHVFPGFFLPCTHHFLPYTHHFLPRKLFGHKELIFIFKEYMLSPLLLPFKVLCYSAQRNLTSSLKPTVVMWPLLFSTNCCFQVI